jgi:hypothetical protein
VWLPPAGKSDSAGDIHGSKKFGCCHIEERDIAYQVMQGNGGAMDGGTQTGQWVFANAATSALIARGNICSGE